MLLYYKSLAALCALAACSMTFTLSLVLALSLAMAVAVAATAAAATYVYAAGQFKACADEGAVDEAQTAPVLPELRTVTRA